MMLECNSKLFSQVVLLAKVHKCTYTSTHDMIICRGAQDIHDIHLVLYTSSVDCEQENMYFWLQHTCVLYLVLYMETFP